MYAVKYIIKVLPKKVLVCATKKIKNIFTYFYGLDHDDFLNLFLLLWLLLALLTQQFVCVGTAQQKQARGECGEGRMLLLAPQGEYLT